MLTSLKLIINLADQFVTFEKAKLNLLYEWSIFKVVNLFN